MPPCQTKLFVFDRLDFNGVSASWGMPLLRQLINAARNNLKQLIIGVILGELLSLLHLPGNMVPSCVITAQPTLKFEYGEWLNTVVECLSDSQFDKIRRSTRGEIE